MFFSGNGSLPDWVCDWFSFLNASCYLWHVCLVSGITVDSCLTQKSPEEKTEVLRSWGNIFVEAYVFSPSDPAAAFSPVVFHCSCISFVLIKGSTMEELSTQST